MLMQLFNVKYPEFGLRCEFAIKSRLNVPLIPWKTSKN